MLLAGEASGDQYGAKVIGALKARFPGSTFFGIGGDRMIAEGFEALFHIRETSIMGFIEVAKNIATIRAMFRRCSEALAARAPAALIPIDYPGFNLRFAKKARAAGVPVVYYISPQVWAWGKDRARKMRGTVDHMAVVFPFETSIYERLGIPVTFVGHPLLEILPSIERAEFLRETGLPDAPVLALLPGSRVQELERLLPPMAEAGARIAARTGCCVAVGAAHLPDEYYAPHLARYPAIHMLRGRTHQLMQHAHAAIVTSGTATVETAYYGTPMVIVYKTSRLNYEIGRRLINVSTIGMANILAGETVATELLQNDVTAEALETHIAPFFEDASLHAYTRERLLLVRQAMGSGSASARVAEIVAGVMRL